MCHSTGLFAGLSLEGTALIERKDANRDFYGSPVPARDILGGRVPPPEVASRLYEVIEAAEGVDETGLPENAYVPTASGDHGASDLAPILARSLPSRSFPYPLASPLFPSSSPVTPSPAPSPSPQSLSFCSLKP